VMTDYEEKFHNMGTKINRCVGTKLAMDPEPEYKPIYSFPTSDTEEETQSDSDTL